MMTQEIDPKKKFFKNLMNRVQKGLLVRYQSKLQLKKMMEAEICG